MREIHKQSNIIANIVKKPHNFMKKKLKTTSKKVQMILRNYILISQKKGKEKCLLGMWVFPSKI